jgi:hypothetical protein
VQLSFREILIIICCLCLSTCGPKLVTPTSDTPANVVTHTNLNRGLRLDPGFFYVSHPGKTAHEIAISVITTIKVAHVNLIYLYAYNSIYGALYPTSYPDTQVEGGLGIQNIAGEIAATAKNNGIKVIFIIPANDFKLVWTNHPTWRVKGNAGADYFPTAINYLLSASSNEFKGWYAGFIDDIILNNPNIDGVELAEPVLDYTWSGTPDQNPSALTGFAAQYPGSAIGSAAWKDFRAQEFLNLIALFNQKVHQNNKEAHLVHTWTVTSTGQLLDTLLLRSYIGFDFISVAQLTGTSKSDFLISEFIWQQGKSEHGTAVFNPEWITTIGTDYLNALKTVGYAGTPGIHVEITPFTGAFNTTTPTKAEFARNVTAAKGLNVPISIYDYNQILTQSAFTELGLWY